MVVRDYGAQTRAGIYEETENNVEFIDVFHNMLQPVASLFRISNDSQMHQDCRVPMRFGR